MTLASSSLVKGFLMLIYCTALATGIERRRSRRMTCLTCGSRRRLSFEPFCNMRSLSFRLWVRIGSMAPALFLMILAGFIFPNSVILRCFYLVGLAVLLPLSMVGVLMGILLVFRKLHFRCPFCSDSSLCIGGGRNSLYIECPRCGIVRGTYSRFPPFTSRIEKEHQPQKLTND